MHTTNPQYYKHQDLKQHTTQHYHSAGDKTHNIQVVDQYY